MKTVKPSPIPSNIRYCAITGLFFTECWIQHQGYFVQSPDLGELKTLLAKCDPQLLNKVTDPSQIRCTLD